jgi:hypothetical protein
MVYNITLMTVNRLGTGEHIYNALQAGEGVVPSGPLQGVPLNVPRSNPNWTLPESMGHLTADFSDETEIKQMIDQSFAEAERTGGTYVPDDIMEAFYDRAKQSDAFDHSPSATAAFETYYVIKGLAFHFPFQMQRVIELNVGRAIVGSYRNQSPHGYQYSIYDNLIPMGIPELFAFYRSIDNRYVNRQDQSSVGTRALVDETERLVAEVMNKRWAVIALPRGDDSLPATELPQSGQSPPTQEEVVSALDVFIENVGSRRILELGLGPTLEGLGKYVMNKATFSGEQNPFLEMRGGLLLQIRKAKGAEAKEELRDLLAQLQDLGDLQSRYNRAK